MVTEFNRLITSDGLELCGLFFLPESGVSDITVIHVHGLAGNFYENRFIDNVANAVVSKGLNFMAFNNRGHDYISDSIHINHDSGEIDYLQLGGAYERNEDSILDIDAFRSFAMSKGSSKYVIMGHSHGALKVANYMYQRQDESVLGSVYLSPSDDFGIYEARAEVTMDDALIHARSLIEAGKERELLGEKYHPYPMSAGTFVDTFKDDSLMKIFNLSETHKTDFPELGSIRGPVLVVFGTVEEPVPFETTEFLKKMERKFTSAVSFDGHVIDSAPHNYMSHEDELANIISDWLGKNFSRDE